MNKEQFLRRLESRLSQLSEDERQKRLDYYEEIIEDMIEDGISEEEAVAGLGDVNLIAETIMQEMPLPALMKSKMTPKKGWTRTAVALAVIGSPIWLSLLLAFICVVLSVYLVFWSAILCVFAAVLSLGACGAYLAVKAFLLLGAGFGYFLLTLGSGLVLLGLCLLSFLAAKVIVRYLLKGTGWFALQVKHLFIRKEAA